MASIGWPTARQHASVMICSFSVLQERNNVCRLDSNSQPKNREGIGITVLPLLLARADEVMAGPDNLKEVRYAGVVKLASVGIFWLSEWDSGRPIAARESLVQLIHHCFRKRVSLLRRFSLGRRRVAVVFGRRGSLK